jgi:hypothetical protein
MSISITNESNDLITLFIREGGVDIRVSIPPKQSKIADDYETKTMTVYKRKGIITVREAQLFESSSFAWLNGEPFGEKVTEPTETMDSSIEPNNDETMDHFHTTEDHEAKSLEHITDVEYLQVNLLKALKVPADLTSLEVIEGEVEQYIEDGYIKGEWTEEDILFLKKNYPTKGRKYCSTHLNRNESSVQKKINSLGVKKKKKKK